MENKDILIMTFEHESSAYQAFSELKQFNLDAKFFGDQMAVVLNNEKTGFEIKEFFDFTGTDKAAKGSLIGMLIGILGGPLGFLVGWFTGSLIGARGDMKEVKEAVSVFENTINLIQEGQTGLILLAEGINRQAIDQLVVDKLDGRVVRMNAGTVWEQVQDAQRAEEELKKESKKKWFNRKED